MTDDRTALALSPPRRHGDDDRAAVYFLPLSLADWLTPMPVGSTVGTAVSG